MKRMENLTSPRCSGCHSRRKNLLPTLNFPRHSRKATNDAQHSLNGNTTTPSASLRCRNGLTCFSCRFRRLCHRNFVIQGAPGCVLEAWTEKYLGHPSFFCIDTRLSAVQDIGRRNGEQAAMCPCTGSGLRPGGEGGLA